MERREHNEVLNLTSAMLERIVMPLKFFRKEEKSRKGSLIFYSHLLSTLRKKPSKKGLKTCLNLPFGCYFIEVKYLC
jgi:hypothetical protein